MAKKKSAAAEQMDAERERGMGDNILPAGGEQLRGLEDRIMSLLDERDEISEDIKEVYAEVKEAGFNTSTLRQAIARRRKFLKDEMKFREAEDRLTLYYATLYEPDTPFEPLNPGLAEQRRAEDMAETV